MNRRFFQIGSVLVGLAALMLAPSVANAQKVGAAAAVKPSSTGTPPGAASHTINIGTDIVSNERIRTTASGSLQVMFLDKTTLTIGPSSDMVVDQFVYQPEAGTGTFAASLTTGALRFVGGQISHTQGVNINTPVATIGIRGGAAFITHDKVCQNKGQAAGAQGCTTVVCTGGKCTVNSRVDSRTFQLKISEAVEIGGLAGARPFNVTSVTLNDVSKGGDGNITTGAGIKAAAGFTGQGTINQTVSEQAPEPPPPG